MIFRPFFHTVAALIHFLCIWHNPYSAQANSCQNVLFALSSPVLLDFGPFHRQNRRFVPFFGLSPPFFPCLPLVWPLSAVVLPVLAPIRTKVSKRSAPKGRCITQMLSQGAPESQKRHFIELWHPFRGIVAILSPLPQLGAFLRLWWRSEQLCSPCRRFGRPSSPIRRSSSLATSRSSSPLALGRKSVTERHPKQIRSHFTSFGPLPPCSHTHT